jgi:hypothetical protein
MLIAEGLPFVPFQLPAFAWWRAGDGQEADSQITAHAAVESSPRFEQIGDRPLRPALTPASLFSPLPQTLSGAQPTRSPNVASAF